LFSISLVLTYISLRALISDQHGLGVPRRSFASTKHSRWGYVHKVKGFGGQTCPISYVTRIGIVSFLEPAGPYTYTHMTFGGPGRWASCGGNAGCKKGEVGIDEKEGMGSVPGMVSRRWWWWWLWLWLSPTREALRLLSVQTCCAAFLRGVAPVFSQAFSC